MKTVKIFILLFLVFTISDTDCQTISDSNKTKYEIKQEKDKLAFNTLKNKILQFSNTTLSEFELILKEVANIEVDTDRKTIRELNFKYNHQIWKVKRENSFLHKFSIIARFDTIIGIKHYDVNNETISKIDSTELKNFIFKQSELLGDFDLKYEFLLPFKLKIYGDGCSFDGSPPKEAQMMYQFVKTKNKKELINWLKSIDPEIQTYAAEGIYYLRKKGIKLNSEEKRIYNLAKSKDRVIITCRGCIYGVKENSNSILNEKKLDKKYKYLKKQNWL